MLSNLLSKTATNHKKIIRARLEQCESIDEMFEILRDAYDLKQSRPGKITKQAYIGSLMKAIDAVKPVINENSELWPKSHN